MGHEENVDFLFFRLDLIADLVDVFEERDIFLDEVVLALGLDRFQFGDDTAG